MSFNRNRNRTREPRKSAVDNGPMFSPRTPATKLYDATGQYVGTFAYARDALAALDALDALDASA